MRKDLIITSIAEIVVLISGIIVYKLAVYALGEEGFYEYALSRRAISFIQPLLLMGLGVGIPRYIAYNILTNPQKSYTYFICGVCLASLSVLVFTLILNLFKNDFAFLIFGNRDYVYLVLPINIMIFGLTFHILCYTYFQGKLLIFKANVLQLINYGIMIILPFFFVNTTEQIILLTGLLIIIVSMFF